MAAQEYCDGHQDLVQAVGRLEGGMQALKDGQKTTHDTLEKLAEKIDQIATKTSYGKGWIAGLGVGGGVIATMLAKLLHL